jgi:nitrite reductase/ring-hydroxylating ferredoxin subunit
LDFDWEVILKMGFVKVLSTEELVPDGMKGVEVNRKKILIANLKGKYYAIGNVCMHMGCLLSDGELSGENVKCLCHGSIYSLKTGSIVAGPTKKPEPVFQVKVEDDKILVNV